MDPAPRRQIDDDDDTAPEDDPARYIDLARANGFFIAARFAAADDVAADEKLWVLNEPYSGMLLTVVSADAEVVNASLHYNV